MGEHGRVISEAATRPRRGELWAWGFVGSQIGALLVALVVDGDGFDECQVQTSAARVTLQWVVAGVSLLLPAFAIRWCRPGPADVHRRLFVPLAWLAVLLAGLCWLILLLPRGSC